MTPRTARRVSADRTLEAPNRRAGRQDEHDGRATRRRTAVPRTCRRLLEQAEDVLAALDALDAAARDALGVHLEFQQLAIDPALGEHRPAR